MTSVLSFILQVHDTVHDFKMKPNYNEPKIYTGGVDVKQWSKLSKKEQINALKKDWYVYYSFRNPETGFLEQQKRIKASANSFSTKSHRLKILQPIQRKLMDILEAGYNPYKEDNSHVKRRLFGEPEKIEVNGSEQKEVVRQPKLNIVIEEEDFVSIKDARQLVFDTKKKVLNENSYPKFTSRINQFYKWIYENGFKEEDGIKSIKKKTVIQYLNNVLQSTSARNRNNTRVDLSSFYATLIDNDVLQENFVKQLKKLNAAPKRNKSYNSELLKDIKDYMKENDPVLSLFVDFVSYGFLRPIEVCRLKIKDLDLNDKKMYIQAKNKLVKEKLLPNILIEKMSDIAGVSKDYDFFTPTNIGGEWDVSDASKRDYFSKRLRF